MKKNMSAVLCACLMLGVLAGCSGGTEAVSEAGGTEAVSETAGTAAETPSEETAGRAETDHEAEGTHTVIDHGGNEVEVPDEITRVVIDQIPILSTYMAYFGGEAPYIVGYCGSFKQTISETVLKNIAPELMESSDTVYAQSDLNIEEIMKLDPDVILYNSGNAQHAEILKASGIPCVGFATVGDEDTEADPLSRYGEWLSLLEDVFGEENKMDAFLEAGDAIVADVESRIAGIPEENRPSALILWKYNDGVPQVSGDGTFGTYWLRHLGVEDPAAEASGFSQVSMEQIYSWDPEILFVDGPGLISIRSGDVLNNTVEGADFSSIKAVKDKRVYGTTLGMWNWFTPNPDAPLVLAWLACRTYPEEFADYPLEDTIRDYYKQWYGYDVTDEELAEMLSY